MTRSGFFLGAFLGILATSPTLADDASGKARSAAGAFSLNDLPAERDGASILTTPAPGRYSIRAKSGAGARIQIVDMIAGPGESAGAAGLRDGRIDALLDKGGYKIRVTGVAGAAGKVKLSADPFVEVETKRPMLTGDIISSELGDLQQRSYTLDLGAEGHVCVEAVGRALQDLRLWAANGDLVETSSDRRMVETRPGRFLTRLRIEADAPPGRYTVTAYGGEKLAWSDGAAAQPLYIRAIAPAPLAAGVAEGVIGPFGTVRYQTPAHYNTLRLELPQPTQARLEARRGKGAAQVALIDKTTREPFANLSLGADDKQTTIAEVAGFEGQAFTLRAIAQASSKTIEASGPHLVSLDLAGEGGDDAPATALLARVEQDGRTQVIASDMPRLAAGRPWRGKFNLRNGGVTSLLFEATDSGPVAIDAKGVKLIASIEPTLQNFTAPTRPSEPLRYDLQKGFYTLLLQPEGDAAGVVDVTIGTPGAKVATAAVNPPRATLSFGERQLERDGSYLIVANVAPMLLTGPRAVPLPVEIDKTPLALWQGAGEKLSLPVRTPGAGKIVARDAKGASVALALRDEKTEDKTHFATLDIAATDKPRALGLSFIADPAKPEDKPKADENDKPRDAPKRSVSRAPLVAAPGKPAFFDLATDERRDVRFEAPKGGLYRIETLGRLQTSVAIGTALAPHLADGADNGPGHNGLVTTYLRAGAYRAAVTAKDSSGHVGLAVTPVSLTTTTALAGDGAARATLDAGKGALAPISIPQDGDYRLDLLGVGHEWRARIEDADGWPLTTPGKLSRLTRKFETGAYRLVVMPEDVEARMIARLRAIPKQVDLAGHGPHFLPFGKVQKLQWREPQAKDAARAPDAWRFSLAGDATVTLSIGDGMVGEIFNGDASVGKVVAERRFSGKLAAGAYRIEARSLAHDDRLDYEISLDAEELQPGAAKRVDLPAKLAFTLAKDSLVDLTTLGNSETLGVLKDASGAVIEQPPRRADDWNVALTRRLPAGVYTLDLVELGAKPQSDETRSSAEGESDSADAAQSETAQAPTEAADDEPGAVEIRLGLPRETDDGALAPKGSRSVDGDAAHVFSLPPSPESALMLVAAHSPHEIALSIETRDKGAAWRVVGVERGLAPVAAWPVTKSEGAEWRAIAWAIGGAKTTIDIAARVVERREQPPGEIALEPVDLADAPLCAGLVKAPGAPLIDMASITTGLRMGSTSGILMRDAQSGATALQSDRLWLLERGDCKERAQARALAWTGAEIALRLDAGETARLPLLPAPAGRQRLWLARAGAPPVGLDAGAGMAVGAQGTLALAGDKPLRLWSASSQQTLRIALSALDVEMLPALKGGALYRETLPPLSARIVEMNAGDAPLEIDLASGVAAFAMGANARNIALFADGAALTRLQHGAGGKLLLVNASDKPAPARVALAAGKSEILELERPLKRFFGAPGELSLRVAARPGDRLVALGGDAAFVSDTGAVSQGRSFAINGDGVASLSHDATLVALWLERDGKSPWPTPAARQTPLPQRVQLDGTVVSLALHQDAPAMIEVKSASPAIVGFSQNGQRDIAAYATGVELHHLMSAGDARLDIYAPSDGVLSGALDVVATPAIAAHEGVNDPIALSPGGGALFMFETTRDGEIGVGLRSEPDNASLRVLDQSGKLLGEGVVQSLKLAKGRYLVEARLREGAPASVLSLAIVGVSPPPAQPPEDVIAELMKKAGLKKTKQR
jgi:hypothetical protein